MHFALIVKVQEAGVTRAVGLLPKDLRGEQGEGATQKTDRNHSSSPQPPLSPRRSTVSPRVLEQCFQNSHPLIDCEINLGGCNQHLLENKQKITALHIIRVNTVFVSVCVCVLGCNTKCASYYVRLKKENKKASGLELSLQMLGT